MNIPEGHKQCSKCGEIKPATIEFFELRKGRTKLHGTCRICENRRKDVWKNNNPDYIQNYREEHRVEAYQRTKLWRKDNPEKVRIMNGQWAKRNRARMNQLSKIWREKHPEKVREKHHQWQQNNPDKVRANSQRRKTIKRSLPHTFTEQHWRHALKYFNGCCAYCGKTPSLFDANTVLHQEHHIPLSKGGGYTPDNILPACQSCNLSKGDKDIHLWLIKRFGKKQTKFIEQRIRDYFEFFVFKTADEMLRAAGDQFGLRSMFED